MEGTEHVTSPADYRDPFSSRRIPGQPVTGWLIRFAVMAGITLGTILGVLYAGSWYYWGAADLLVSCQAIVVVSLGTAVVLASTLSLRDRELTTADRVALLAFQLLSMALVIVSNHPHAQNDVEMGIVITFALIASISLARREKKAISGWTGIPFWGIGLLTLLPWRVHIPGEVTWVFFLLHAAAMIIELQVFVWRAAAR